MATRSLKSGLRVTAPSSFRVEPAAARDAVPGRPSGVSGRPAAFDERPPELADEKRLLREALETQAFEFVDAIVFAPKMEETALSGRRRRGAETIPRRQTVDLELDLEEHEDALALLEQDGLYAWCFPSEIVSLHAPRTGRAMPARPRRRRVHFAIDVHATSSKPRRLDRRGFVRDLIYSRITAFVFKFAARLATPLAIKFLERHVDEGLVKIASRGLASWKKIDDPSRLALPAERPARLLLFVHGTFSSTRGSFGALSQSAWGRALLRRASERYDAVLGFDHRTLSEDPLSNAVAVLDALERLRGAHPLEIDIVAFSRGGLVARSLIEHLLPVTQGLAKIGRVVFVASTNGGTRLAEPDNWHRLADLYTNLALAAFRLIALAPQAKLPAELLGGLISSVGALVKYLATHTTSEAAVPGLAAMEPDGRFVTELNRTQPGQPSPGEARYYAVTATFDARLALDGETIAQLPHKLLLMIADGLVDQLMGTANDLVVDLPSMTAIDPPARERIKDRLEFDSRAEVFHTVYFTRPELADSLTRWLALDQKRASKARPPARGRRLQRRRKGRDSR
ncbi:MAG: hypothetical protein JSV80_13640 [Acidobacteriota bacterium]|nr:MAG: hypothetical protein JSV80_13640 [Acidobacteriota bacterium]